MTPELLQQIKLDDPGGDLDVAFAAMAVMEETAALSSYTVNVMAVVAAYGMEVAEGIRQVIAANFPTWVLDAFVSVGLDIAQANTQAKITNPPFSNAQVVQLLAMTTETRLKYPGLKPGHLLEARAL